jgi:NhaA family Na+:H+ antiporter
MNIPPRIRGALKVQAEHSYIARHVLLPAQAFVRTEAASGVILLAAAVAAIVWANSPWDTAYADLWDTTITVDVGLFSISDDLRHWINEGLMTFFFFVVGLEIKRELVHGELGDLRRAAAPAVAALGGMAVPALIFLALNAGGHGARGWGIPMATDIAFALGVLALLGRRIPSEVRIFLLALAIVDDIGAILVVAIFYTEGLSFDALGIALLLLGVIAVMRYAGVQGANAYFLVGALLWAAMVKSGVHATIAGVVLGLLTPANPYFGKRAFAASIEPLIARFRDAVAEGDEEKAETVLGQVEELAERTEAPLERLERLLHPMTSFAVIPLFALANAGLNLSGGVFRDSLSSPITLGIILGLVIGNPVGIVGFSWVAVRLGITSLPAGMRWVHVVGIGLLGGMGFTVSLFITGLAFEDAGQISEAKVGILAASVIAGLAGYTFLRAVGTDRPRVPGEKAACSTSAK